MKGSRGAQDERDVATVERAAREVRDEDEMMRCMLRAIMFWPQPVPMQYSCSMRPVRPEAEHSPLPKGIAPRAPVQAKLVDLEG